MSILKVIRERKSIRKYKVDSIPEETLFRILEAGRLAPSGKNFQPWKFIVVKDKIIKEKLVSACAGQSFIAQAPIVIAACGFPEESYAHMGRYMKSWPIDVAIALEHMILQAWEEGLGTCWIGAFKEDEVKSILEIPRDVKVLALTPVGYPAKESRFRGRKPLEEIISYDKF